MLLNAIIFKQNLVRLSILKLTLRFSQFTDKAFKHKHKTYLIKSNRGYQHVLVCFNNTVYKSIYCIFNG